MTNKHYDIPVTIRVEANTTKEAPERLTAAIHFLFENQKPCHVTRVDPI